MSVKIMHPNCVMCVNNQEPKTTNEQAICSVLILIHAFGEKYMPLNLCKYHGNMLEKYYENIKKTDDATTQEAAKNIIELIKT